MDDDYLEIHAKEIAYAEVKREVGKFIQKIEIPYRQVQKIMKNAKTKLMSEVSGKIFGNYVVANMEIVLDCEDNVTPENIMDILEDTLSYLKYMVESRQVPAQKCFIKELKPIRLKKII